MSIFWGVDHFAAPEQGAAVTIGVFDGLHLGHQSLLRRLCETGRERALGTVAVTFDRHPLEVVGHHCAPLLLSTPRDRAEKIGRSGVNRVLALHFDEVLAAISAEEFVDDILIGKVGMRCAVVGQNFRFGRKRTGDPELLAKLGRSRGFSVEVVPPCMLDGEPISSTRVRSVLEQGDVHSAGLMLGCHYTLKGKVVHGDARGREIGFPTANIQVPERILVPANGVYAVNGRFNGMQIRGAANIGVRPTVGGGTRSVEVHLVGYRGDLYDQEMEVSFLGRLRDEVRFESLDALKQQIRADIHQALDVSSCLRCQANMPQPAACPV